MSEAEKAAEEKQVAVLARVLARKAARLAAPAPETIEERLLRLRSERAVRHFANHLGAAALLLDAHEFLGGAEVTERLVRAGYLGYDERTTLVTCQMG
jgi:hypothetical protein